MTTKHISIKTRETRIERRRRYHYNSNTPFVKLIKPEYHDAFNHWYNTELRKFLRGTEGIEYYKFCKFDFKQKTNSRSASYSNFYISLAKFLAEIGKGDGLAVKLSMIFRYITDINHSNLPISENTLKSRINEVFRLYI